MKTVLLLALAFILAGCSTVPRQIDAHGIAMGTFGTDRNLKVHEVEYKGWLRTKFSNMGSRDDFALYNDMEPATGRDVDIAVWGGSSANIARATLRALQYPDMQKLPHLRFLFIGDAADAEKVRPAIEATGAIFYFHQR